MDILGVPVSDLYQKSMKVLRQLVQMVFTMHLLFIDVIHARKVALNKIRVTAGISAVVHKSMRSAL